MDKKSQQVKVPALKVGKVATLEQRKETREDPLVLILFLQSIAYLVCSLCENLLIGILRMCVPFWVCGMSR